MSGWLNCHPLVRFAHLSLLHAWLNNSTVFLWLHALVMPWRGCLTSERLVSVCPCAESTCAESKKRMLDNGVDMVQMMIMVLLLVGNLASEFCTNSEFLL